jgi:hypothetical protein
MTERHAVPPRTADPETERTLAARDDRAARGNAALEDEAGRAPALDAHVPLFDDGEGRGFRSRWEAIQTGFVDEPRASVEQADALVSQLMGRLTDVFSRERATLEQQWSRGESVSTEELRLALKRYRSFFERLLTV